MASDAPVPTLITLDVHEHARLNAVLLKSAEFLSQFKQKVTYFVPAAFVRRDKTIASTLRELETEGHRIGCHGLTHTPEEDPFRLSASEEAEMLRTATGILADTLGRSILSFRAPVYRLSNRTLPILDSLGYKADLSVVPQRCSFLSSSPWSLGGVLAPRNVYHPHEQSPYKRGSLSILEIPNSCLFLPLAHGAMTGFRRRGMMAMVACLKWEALHFGRVLVLTFHPETLAGDDWYYPNRPWKMSDLFPRPYGGMALRYHFTDITPEKSKGIATHVMRSITSDSRLDCSSVEQYLGSISLTDELDKTFIAAAEA